MRSMTGFGRSTGTLGGNLSISVSVRTVNHRYLEVSIRLPEILWDLEPLVRNLVSAELRRGKVDVSVRMQKGEGAVSKVTFDHKIALEAVEHLGGLQAKLGLAGDLRLRDVLQIPGVVVSEPALVEIDENLLREFAAIMREALSGVTMMREGEGRILAEDISARIEQVSEARRKLAGHRDEFVRDAVESYRKRVLEIASVAGIEIDEQRLAQETVLMVDKGDIAEEITRLESHELQTRALFDSAGADGKKLDFLAQEMLREINTIGSKSRSAEIRGLVIELKTQVERIREQAQNVE